MYLDQMTIFMGISRVSFVMLALTHATACFWFGLGSWDESSGWVERDEVAFLSIGDQYARCFHFALGLFYGEPLILPSTTEERVFLIIALFFLYLISVWIVASLTTAMTRLQILTSRTAGQLTKLSMFLSANHISRSLKLKVHRNAQHAIVQQERNAPEANVELLQVISNPLLIEVHFEIHSPALWLHPFFPCYHDINPRGIRRTCNSAMNALGLSRDDTLFSQFEKSVKPLMYFVLQGTLLYMQEGVTRHVTVTAGMWISEPELWTSNWIHQGTLRALTECRLAALDARKFQELISTFPSNHAILYADAFVHMLNDTAAEITDIGSMQTVEKLMELAFPQEFARSKRSSSASIRESIRSSLRSSTKKPILTDQKS
eukprot:gnl/TRDRNA2_/TRDRNA2_168904_c0_seq1.p1 gnl/TRDRNA2_/TRDRNA2_168904_c0~~gnl/TRDRNA2_/TRDRNA2_168904_c0_seq1.p1  ORF type:complete len:376 (-),score=40.79 gnl/TRDRNA2_/TRDRNA2_168904_c0_seq1:89-1216(-)